MAISTGCMQAVLSRLSAMVSTEPVCLPPLLQAADLGMHMLLELFAGHRECRRELISLCQNRLMGAKVRAGSERGCCVLAASTGDSC